MPADADLLCEYYLSANLNEKTSKQSDEETTSYESAPNASNSMEVLKTKFTTFNNKNKSPVSFNQNDLTTANNLYINKNTSWLDLNWCKIRKTGIGLLNLGNNCYLNATLQCLAYTPPLSQWLVFRPHSPMCKFKQLKGFCSLCEVEKIIYDIFNSCNGCVKPNSLCFNIKKISNVFGVGTQEDASEFFTTLLESMARSIKFAINLDLKQTNNSNVKKTILDDIFSFQFRSRITCCNCGKLSDTYENTNTWPVDVKYVQDIRKGMLHFLREEVLDGDNRYNCEKCNKKVRATKKYSLKTAPNILVVHLKRFDFTYAGKLTHFVTYPEILNLKSFMSDNEVKTNSSEKLNSNEHGLKNTTYKLYGVLVHLGYTSHSGHYYSYVRGPNDVWYKADDQQVNTVQTQDVLGQNAYILFYNRISNTVNNTLSPNVTSTSQVTTPKKDYFQSNSLHKSSPINSFKSSFQSCTSSLTDSIKTAHLNIPKLLNNEQAEKSVEPTVHQVILPIEKFKSTFVAVDIIEKNKSLNSVNDAKEEIDKTLLNNKEEKKNNTKTLNYDQVLRIKKLNKRNLKLLNKKKELDELKKTKIDEKDSKKIKKQIRKLKRQIKKYKIKIKKLKKQNKKRLKNDSNSSDDSDKSLNDLKNKITDDESGYVKKNNIPIPKKCVNSITNSLSLLKQYHSSSSSSSLESSPFSSPKSHSRSSISSAHSSASSVSSESSMSSSSSNKWRNTLDSNSETPKRKLNDNNSHIYLKTESEKSKTPESTDSALKAKSNDDNSLNNKTNKNDSLEKENSKKLKYSDSNNDYSKPNEEYNTKINNRPEFDSSSNSKYFNPYGNKNSNNTNNKYLSTNYKFYQKSNINNPQYSWRNNYKYKYSSPHYQNNHYNNYKNKSYNHFSRY